MARHGLLFSAHPIYRIQVLAVTVISGIATLLAAPTAHADDSVTYEVVADQGLISAANIEYNEHSERKTLLQVSLPWRLTVAVPNAVSPARNGAELRADWGPYRWPYKYVTVRIYLGNRLLCENTLDVGNATCYGGVAHRDFPQTGGG